MDVLPPPISAFMDYRSVSYHEAIFSFSSLANVIFLPTSPIWLLCPTTLINHSFPLMHLEVDARYGEI